jgi:hypothetical protein
MGWALRRPCNPVCSRRFPADFTGVSQKHDRCNRKTLPETEWVARYNLGPRLPERPERLDGQLAQAVKAASLAEGQELALQEFPALLDRGGGQVPDGGFGEELLDCLGDGRDLGLEDANLAGGLALMHDRGGGGPIGGVETAADRLAAS